MKLLLCTPNFKCLNLCEYNLYKEINKSIIMKLKIMYVKMIELNVRIFK